MQASENSPATQTGCCRRRSPSEGTYPTNMTRRRFFQTVAGAASPGLPNLPLLGYGKRDEADEACRKVFVLARECPEVVPLFAQAAHSWLCRKASDDSHEYKFLAAILEDPACVSPAWQPHLLAASVHYFHGKQTPDNPVMHHVQEALQHKG